MGSLKNLFAPERVAVVGATDREGSVGHAVTQNLVTDFEGEVIPVNPDKDEILGLECYESLAAAPEADVAVVVVPAGITADVVREAGEKGIKNVVVITAGFSEAGSEGADRERKLVELSEEYDLNLVGPNCIGVMNTSVGLNATFAPENADPGNVSFMSQSGAFITAVLNWAKDNNLGFKNVVSLGNKAVLDESDFIQAWGDDPETEVVLGYLEDIDNGRDFVETAREVTQDTPVLVVKSGRTDAGASAAASHTGAIAGSDKAYEAGLDEAGVLRVDNVQELFDAASILAGQPLPDDDSVAIITNAGGPGVMTTDAVGDSNLELAELEDETLDKLSDELPEGANIYNPVDIIGDAPYERFEKAVDIVLDDPNVGMAVVLACPTATLEFDDLADATVRQREKHESPIAGVLMGGSTVRSAKDKLSDAGIPSYFDPARAVQSLESLAEYAEIQERELTTAEEFDVDRDRAEEIIQSAIDRGRARIGVEGMELLDAYGIPTPEGDVVDDPRRAREIVEELDGNAVMKIVSPDILHKSDIGGVEVGVSADEAWDTYEDLVARARQYQPDADIIGVQVQEMIDLDAGTETIVGTTRDPQFGQMVMFGLGGIFVEILEDTSFRLAPVPGDEAEQMINEIETSPLLHGARGREPVDTDGLVEVIQRISQLVSDFPMITELDINPAVAAPDGVTAVDLRLTIEEEEL
jgi:acetyl coenzyme A synthetase (ADP forming)-like protein